MDIVIILFLLMIGPDVKVQFRFLFDQIKNHGNQSRA
ncbi:hypothetical protein SAMN05421821_102109 [Mucilaginibacter lappiensis]|uniref:Uncharacterized protein n=1 Tax=Mucilaginibacter lappiensis TaxID=354630 RepID=A0ABR6PFW6_9SPHI|nr:hypothetical protein [Mucilaginibacter lappiensis]SIQ29086.1 hypothetical protein SAMN05421821_102109 [Mucilaginibacter lappiensis]